MANEILSYESNAWMAVSTYKDLSIIMGKNHDISNEQYMLDYQSILTEESGLITKKSDFTQEQAEEFAKRYRVDYQYFDDVTGFGATLFWDIEQNKHIVAIRGTEPDSFKDILNDVFLATAGIAYEQEVALEAFYTRISTSKEEGGLGLLSEDEKIDVTGHSLGGFLTQVFVSKHQDIVNQAYSYNAPGIDGIWGNIKTLFNFEDNYPNDKITNITAKDGLSLISDLGINLGSIDIEFPGDSHSGVNLANIISFYSIFSLLNETITVNEINNFYYKYSFQINNVEEKVVNELLNIFEISSVDKIENNVLNIISSVENSNLNLEFLTTKTQTQLQDKTLANLYALENLNPFVIEGDFEVYNNIDVSKYTDQYLEDRATYLYYLLDKKIDTI